MLYPDYEFSDDFCHDIRVACDDAVGSRTSFNLVATPGVGVTFFVKYFERRTDARFVYINPYEMHEFTRVALYEQLATKLGLDSPDTATLDDIRQALLAVSETESTVVVLFNRFDRLGDVLDERFYDQLRHLRDANRSKIVFGFVTGAPLIDAAGASGLVGLVTRTLYFPGYGNADMQQILHGSGARVARKSELDLAGGHHLLLQVIMGCQDAKNALSDPMVELLVRDTLTSMPHSYRRKVERLVLKGTTCDDQYLLSTRFVRNSKDGQKLFTPLIAEYIKRGSQAKLPLKERRLLALLKRNAGQVVSKQAIYDYVWREQNGIASEWSLNALVYRLRRHPGFDSKRYDIESRKKSGYVLIDAQHP